MAAGETWAESAEEGPWIGTQKARRIRRPHTLYATVIRTYLKRADHRIVKLTDIRIALDTAYAGLLLEKATPMWTMPTVCGTRSSAAC